MLHNNQKSFPNTQSVNNVFIKALAAIAKDVYNNDASGPVRGWHRYDSTPGETASGYFGAVYLDDLKDPTKAIIAHRGTNDIIDYIADWNIFRGKSFAQMKDAGDFDTHVKSKLFNDFKKIIVVPYYGPREENIDEFEKRFYYCHTGHSLGAILAEYTGMMDQAVTFENPGAKPVFWDYIDIGYPDEFTRNYIKQLIAEHAKQHNTTIQSHVNLINSCNEQLGNVHRLWNKPYKYDTTTNFSLLDPFDIPEKWYHSLYYVKTYLLQQHGMNDIKEYIEQDGEIRPDHYQVGFQNGYIDFLDTSRHINFWMKHFNDVYETGCPMSKLHTQEEFLAIGLEAVNTAKSNAEKSLKAASNFLPHLPKFTTLTHDPRIFAKTQITPQSPESHDNWVIVDEDPLSPHFP